MKRFENSVKTEVDPEPKVIVHTDQIADIVVREGQNIAFYNTMGKDYRLVLRVPRIQLLEALGLNQ